MRNSESDSPVPPDPSVPGELAPLHSEDESWLDIVRRAESPRTLNRIGSYEILEEIRSGAQGLVYRAKQAETGRSVALKRLSSGAFSSDREKRRFEREIELSSLLEHPGIVTVYGVETEGGVPLLAMEWVDGQALDDWADEQPRTPEGLTAKLRALQAICEAIAFAHSSGVLHRDLKPKNLLVDGHGRPRVLDFGLARRVDAEEADEMTRTAGFIGTPAYAAPECFESHQRSGPDGRSDVYSLGVVLYRVLTAELPYPSTGLRELVAAQDRGTVRPPSKVARELGREVDAVVAKAMAREPEDRYATAHALGEDLGRLIEGLPVQAVPPRWSYLAVKWVQRRPVTASVIAGGVLLLTGLLVNNYRQGIEVRKQRDLARGEAEYAEQVNAELTLALEASKTANERTRSVRDFYLDAVFLPGRHYAAVSSTRLEDVIGAAVDLARERFAEDDDLTLEILPSLARSQISMGSPESGLELCKEMLALLEQMPAMSWSRKARIELSMAEAYKILGDSDTALSRVRLATEALEQLENPEDFPRLRTVVYAGRGVLEGIHENFEPARDWLQRSRALAQQVPDRFDLEAQATDQLLFALQGLGDQMSLNELTAEVLADPRYEAANWARVRANFLELEVMRCSEEGDTRGAARANQQIIEARRLAEEDDLEPWFDQAGGIGLALMREGDYEAALENLQLAYDHTNTSNVRAQTSRGLAHVYAAKNNVELASRYIKEASEAHLEAYPLEEIQRMGVLLDALNYLLEHEDPEAERYREMAASELEARRAEGLEVPDWILEAWAPFESE